MSEKIAVYAGSFDPVTNGHVNVARRAREVFGQVFHHAVAVYFVQKAVGPNACINGAFPFVAKGSMPNVVPEANCIGHIFA